MGQGLRCLQWTLGPARFPARPFPCARACPGTWRPTWTGCGTGAAGLGGAGTIRRKTSGGGRNTRLFRSRVEGSIRSGVGGEVGWQNMVFLRGGYRSLFGRESAFKRDVQQDGLTLGAGVKYRMEGIATVEVNYAYMKFGLFGNLSTIALSIGL